ncbi:hypothetical protein [Streptomyces katrae]|uniref:hypothetical protein n=1 Tax=Streptomyces katrae TaxID=68223 RepID=UPI000B119B5B|nr:hypothetical protein [Streptomyces katrae]
MTEKRATPGTGRGFKEKAVIHLDWIYSSGPKDADGSGTPCGGCHKVPSAGQAISKVRGRWWHVDCAVAELDQISAAAAWITLGELLAARPSSFTTVETRTIVKNLLALAKQPASPQGGKQWKRRPSGSRPNWPAS